MILRSVFLSACCFLLVACMHQHKHDAVLEQAGQIHLEAVKMDKKIRPALTKISNVKEQLEQKQRKLTPEESRVLQQITQLERSYAFWEENHVEVPGMEHAGHHNCSHNHSPDLEVSSEDMLLIQQEFKDSLSSIAERLEKFSIPDSLITK